jgi:hypothetical protein
MSDEWMRDHKGKITKIMDEVVIVFETEEERAELIGRLLGETCELRQQAYMDGVRIAQEDMAKTGIKHGAVREIKVDERVFMIPYALFIASHPEHPGGYYFWDPVGIQCPKKGEPYITGTSQPAMEAFVAVCDLDQEHLVIKATHKAKKQFVWRQDEEDKKGG